MTPVKEKLTGRQYRLEGRDSHGRETILYISNEVEGLLHLNLNGREIWLNTDLMIEAIGLLKYGDRFEEGLKHARHAKELNNEV